MKRFTTVLILASALACGACDSSKSDGETTQTTQTTSQPETNGQSGQGGQTAGETAPKTVSPELYMQFVDRGLMKQQANITRCTLPWKKQFPDQELKVVLVFNISPSGKVTGARAEAPKEADKIARCIEAVMTIAQFSPGAPDQPFKKTMIFNPQDPEIEQMKVKGLPDK